MRPQFEKLLILKEKIIFLIKKKLNLLYINIQLLKKNLILIHFLHLEFAEIS